MITTESQRLQRSKGSRSQLLQTTNPLITRRPLSGSPDCPSYWVAPVLGQGIPHTHTINVAHHLLAAVDKTFNVFSYDAVWADPIEPITFPKPSRYAMLPQNRVACKKLCKDVILIEKDSKQKGLEEFLNFRRHK